MSFNSYSSSDRRLIGTVAIQEAANSKFEGYRHVVATIVD